jgi:O-antigen ligase
MNSLVKIEKFSIYICVLSSLIIFPFFMDPINLPKFFLLTLGCGIIGIMISRNKVLKLKIFNKSIVFTVALYISLLCLSAVTNDQSVYANLVGTWGRNNGLIANLILIFLFFVFSILSSKSSEVRIINSLFYLGLIFAPYAWLQNFKKDPVNFFFPWYNSNDAIVLTVGNSNFASVLLSVTFSATLVVALRKSINHFLRAVALISGIAHIFLIPKIDTQGKINFGVAFVVVIGITLSFSGKKAIKQVGIFWWCASIVIGILGLFGLKGLGPFSYMLSDNIRALNDRYHAWLAAFKIMQDFPFLGTGLDSFGFYYRNYRDSDAYELRTGQPLVTYDNAHNTYFQLGSTAGILTLICYLVLVILVSWRMLVALKMQMNKSEVSGLAAIWIIYLVQSLVSMDQLGLAIWGWVSAGALVGLSYTEAMGSERVHITKRFQKIANISNKIPIFLVFLIPAIYLTPTLRNDFQIYMGIRDIPRLNSESARIQNLQMLKNEAEKSNQLELRLTTIRYLGKANLIDDALSLSLSTAEKFPRSFAAWNLVAGIYEMRGNYELAIPAREKTVYLDPLNAGLKIQLENDIKMAK